VGARRGRPFGKKNERGQALGKKKENKAVGGGALCKQAAPKKNGTLGVKKELVRGLGFARKKKEIREWAIIIKTVQQEPAHFRRRINEEVG